MKQLVVYSSKGGNTRKLAEAAFSRLSGEKEISPVAGAPDPGDYDVVVVAFWYQGGQPDSDSQQYLKKCKGVRKLFLLATHGAAKDSDISRLGMNKARELASGANIVGTFSCQGEVPQNVLDAAANKDPQPPWLKDAATATGHPDREDFYELSLALEKAGVVEVPKPGEKRMFS
ncbi:MAG: flavodoxin family protein [Desulfobulbaceae bacterium]|jgi:flavodoxin|nr:flavodoxin family protein [Desulfobulbaceae bacterium]MDY0351127.1 flavodoxin family protein [Desulfobulbaceae bacterium]